MGNIYTDIHTNIGKHLQMDISSESSCANFNRWIIENMGDQMLTKYAILFFFLALVCIVVIVNEWKSDVSVTCLLHWVWNYIHLRGFNGKDFNTTLTNLCMMFRELFGILIECQEIKKFFFCKKRHFNYFITTLLQLTC